MKKFIIIPARLDSQRLPRKMLMEVDRIPIIVHTYNNLSSLMFLGVVSDIFVTSADQEIIDVCSDHGINTVKLNEPAVCGTHACFNAYKILNEEADLVNVQGDCPDIDTRSVSQIFEYLEYHHDIACTLHYESRDIRDAHNPARVKVVFDKWDNMIYNSRSAIPYNANIWNIHLGVYGFPAEIINEVSKIYSHDFASINPSEKLEQLSWIENGIKIHSILSNKTSSIDTQEDYDKFKQNYINR